MAKIALFDMDGTLVRTNTARLYIRYEFKRGRASVGQVGKVFTWLLKYGFGLGDAYSVAAQGLTWYQGRSEAELRADSAEWFEEYVRREISDAARAAVRSHLDAGDTVAIATSATRYVAEPVARFLGIPHLICSELQIVDGRLSGELIHPLCYGQGKLERVQGWIAARGGSVAEGTVFYSDSITDVPLLEAVQTPVVVNPDMRLRLAAKQRGWRVESW